jgi:hypothetical protein
MPLPPLASVLLKRNWKLRSSLGVAVVVDVDLVQRVRVHREVVGAAVGVLQRLVVGDQRDIAAAAGS